MKERMDREVQGFDPIEDALRTYPLAPVPPDFSPAVMFHIRALSTKPALQFRLTWLDYAVMLFSAAMLGVGFFLWQILTPELWPQLQYELPFMMQNLNWEIWGSIFIGGIALVALSLLLAGVILGQTGGSMTPRSFYREVEG